MTAAEWLARLHEPLIILLIQLIAVIAAARLLGALFTRMDQPAVIGEIVAGILLGPSLLGALSPEILDFLFPASSTGTLKLFSQIGVLLFMFVVGMDLDAKDFRGRTPALVVISLSSIVVPFVLGMALSLAIYPSLAREGSSFMAFALFMGIAMSITAFPVLARIITERGMNRTPLGQAALTCAAVGDVAAWCLLAVVVAIVKSSGLMAAGLTVVLALAFIAVMFALVRPRIERLIEQRFRGDRNNRGLVSGMIVFALASAAFTETIGIHALFGAFLAGVVIPARTRFHEFLHARMEAFAGFLMPLFFVMTGLRTQIGLLDGWADWLTCFGIIVVAVTGKLCGAMFAARWTGMEWRDAFGIGVLMNARGLMELIVLNIGYDLGILSPRIFAMMVIMALVTTFMTGPLLALAAPAREKTARAH